MLNLTLMEKIKDRKEYAKYKTQLTLEKVDKAIREISLKGEKINISEDKKCFWQVKFQAFRNLIFQAPHPHYWEFMVECVSL